MTGFRYAPFPFPPRFFVSVTDGDREWVKERGTTDVWPRNNGARGRVIRMDSRTNGALLLLLRRLVAGRTWPVEILRFVVARKNPEDWLKEGG